MDTLVWLVEVAVTHWHFTLSVVAAIALVIGINVLIYAQTER